MPNIARDELLTSLRRLRPDLERDGVTHMSLFGSRARGDHRPDSDIDLMIEVNDDQPFSMLKVVGIGHIVEDSIGLPANIFMKRSLDDKFVREAQPDLVRIF
ncbi:nucleotidyltransferase family protein [Devosia riboflavina]|uniref:nucleotidyltransferase family protein n=1 Tax=Devosia riboflavina TaxID=46914 RepID=UPI00068FB4A0|nr:nucleotidyltransferase domain-containing protein [Devosia riboflavina]